MTETEKLKKAESETNPNPSIEEIKTGYSKGRFSSNGFNFVVENPVGSTREGVDEQGRTWSSEIHFTYGFIEGTIGSDGDEIDVFFNSDIDQDFNIYIIAQSNSKRIFDEHKVMYGFRDFDSAKSAYLSNYEEGWDRIISITTLSIDSFREWLLNKMKERDNSLSINTIKMKDEKSNLETRNRIRTIELEGEVVEDETLNNLKSQAGDSSDYDTLVVKIASPGGSVYEGLLIMIWLNLLSSLDKKVVTVVTANAYSIASLIMLVADRRFISNSADIMVHNPMVPKITHANANLLESHVVKLRELESVMYELYSTFTGLPLEGIKELMDNETYLNAEDSVYYGFADEVVDLEPREKSLSTNKNNKIKNMSGILNKLNRIIAMVSGSEIVNQLYYDNTGGELQIYQQDPSTYKVGDKTSIDTGTVTLSDGSVLTIEGGEIKTIDKSTAIELVVEPAPAAVEPAAPTEPVTPVEPVVAAEPAVTPTEPDKTCIAPVAEFNVGPAPAEPKPVAVEPVVMPVEPAPVAVEPVVAPTEPAEPAEPAEFINPEDPTIVAILKSIEELKSMLEGLSSMKSDMTSLKQFEQVATEAIEAIAENTVSVFRPEARATGVTKAAVESGGTIFTRMKALRGIQS